MKISKTKKINNISKATITVIKHNFNPIKANAIIIHIRTNNATTTFLDKSSKHKTNRLRVSANTHNPQ